MIGTTVSHYRIVDEIGRGGMGIVYKAVDVRLDRHVALKFLGQADIPGNRSGRERFIQEAMACSALDHANVGVIYEIGDAPNGALFIAMAYYDGQTLERLLKAGQLPIHQAISFAGQVASGLSHAHAAGIVHRDVKPSNIVINRDGVAKIIDFGIARMGQGTHLTTTGTRVGTLAYMSPEQLRGESVDGRTDVWSVGIILYEMLTGRRPFDGPTDAATLRNILDTDARPLASSRSDLSVGLQQIVDRALAKDPSLRFVSATDLERALSKLHVNHVTANPAIARFKRWGTAAGVGLLITIATMVGYRAYNVQWARQQALPRILTLADEHKYLEAFALAREAERYLGTDAVLQRAWPRFSTVATIETTPPGADVFMKPYEQPESEWQRLGTTPLREHRIPRGHFRWKLQQAGYQVVEQARRTGNYTSMGDVRFSWTLDREDVVPTDMVRVPGIAVTPQLSTLDHLPAVQLNDYWIDRHEVTNKQFKQFVDGGGYRRKEFWQQPFIADGDEVTWEVAMSRFRDATGREGPAGWMLANYPKGQDDYPVTGISWYEAAAYAQFVGKTLPTVYQWSAAAGTRTSPFVVALSNIESRESGPARVGQFAGLSEMGTLDMAGNAKEWCWNQTQDQSRYVLGGSWNEPLYKFIQPDAANPWDRSSTHGFRCVKPAGRAGDDVAQFGPLVGAARDFAAERPVSNELFDAYRSLYLYDRSPLNVRVESVDSPANAWTTEKVSFDAAYDGERVLAYVFVPRSAGRHIRSWCCFPARTPCRIELSASRRSITSTSSRPVEPW